MSRLKEVRKVIEKKLNKIDDADTRNSAVNHLYGVSLTASVHS